MKFFKKLFLVIPLLLSLASCKGNDSIAGTYSFQLGSDDGKHAGIHLRLDDTIAEDADVEEGVTAKTFELTFDVDTSMAGGVAGILTNLDIVIEYLNDHPDIDITKLDQIMAEIQEEIEKKGRKDQELKIPGYYYMKDVTNAEGRSETRVMMGINLNLIKDIPITIPEALFEMLMYATYTNDNINIYIPVSFKDLLYQIYWYGYRISSLDTLMAPVDLHEENPFLEHNPIGSHPTDDQVEKIATYQNQRNDTQPAGYEIGELIYCSYHNYHTLTMGLAKNG